MQSKDCDVECEHQGKFYTNTHMCYNFFEEAMTWENASKFCQKNGGELASVQSREINSFLRDLASTYVWIGGLRKNASSWSWTDNSDWHYENKNSPKMNEGVQDVVLALNGSSADGEWSDEYVSEKVKNPFICQFPMKGWCFFSEYSI